ncbi:hypothetical protein C0J52_15562 [Blattella germanica]|nr:hypothetical protein C0J52_15562 [Blattella germanica]
MNFITFSKPLHYAIRSSNRLTSELLTSKRMIVFRSQYQFYHTDFDMKNVCAKTMPKTLTPKQKEHQECINFHFFVRKEAMYELTCMRESLIHYSGNNNSKGGVPVYLGQKTYQRLLFFYIFCTLFWLFYLCTHDDTRRDGRARKRQRFPLWHCYKIYPPHSAANFCVHLKSENRDNAVEIISYTSPQQLCFINCDYDQTGYCVVWWSGCARVEGRGVIALFDYGVRVYEICGVFGCFICVEEVQYTMATLFVVKLMMFSDISDDKAFLDSANKKKYSLIREQQDKVRLVLEQMKLMKKSTKQEDKMMVEVVITVSTKFVTQSLFEICSVFVCDPNNLCVTLYTYRMPDNNRDKFQTYLSVGEKPVEQDMDLNQLHQTRASEDPAHPSGLAVLRPRNVIIQQYMTKLYSRRYPSDMFWNFLLQLKVSQQSALLHLNSSQITLAGHVQRMGELEIPVSKRIMESKFEGKRKVGLPRLRWIDAALEDLNRLKGKVHGVSKNELFVGCNATPKCELRAVSRLSNRCMWIMLCAVVTIVSVNKPSNMKNYFVVPNYVIEQLGPVSIPTLDKFTIIHFMHSSDCVSGEDTFTSAFLDVCLIFPAPIAYFHLTCLLRLFIWPEEKILSKLQTKMAVKRKSRAVTYYTKSKSALKWLRKKTRIWLLAPKRVQGLSHWCRRGEVSVIRFEWLGRRIQMFRGLLEGFKRPIPTSEDLVQALRGRILSSMIDLLCCRFFELYISHQCRPETVYRKYAKRPTTEPLLTREHCVARLQFSQVHHNWTMEEWGAEIGKQTYSTVASVFRMAVFQQHYHLVNLTPQQEEQIQMALCEKIGEDANNSRALQNRKGVHVGTKASEECGTSYCSKINRKVENGQTVVVEVEEQCLKVLREHDLRLYLGFLQVTFKVPKDIIRDDGGKLGPEGAATQWITSFVHFPETRAHLIKPDLVTSQYCETSLSHGKTSADDLRKLKWLCKSRPLYEQIVFSTMTEITKNRRQVMKEFRRLMKESDVDTTKLMDKNSQGGVFFRVSKGLLDTGACWTLCNLMRHIVACGYHIPLEETRGSSYGYECKDDAQHNSKCPCADDHCCDVGDHGPTSKDESGYCSPNVCYENDLCELFGNTFLCPGVDDICVRMGESFNGRRETWCACVGYSRTFVRIGQSLRAQSDVYKLVVAGVGASSVASFGRGWLVRKRMSVHDADACSMESLSLLIYLQNTALQMILWENEKKSVSAKRKIATVRRITHDKNTVRHRCMESNSIRDPLVDT